MPKKSFRGVMGERVYEILRLPWGHETFIFYRDRHLAVEYLWTFWQVIKLYSFARPFFYFLRKNMVVELRYAETKASSNPFEADWKIPNDFFID